MEAPFHHVSGMPFDYMMTCAEVLTCLCKGAPAAAAAARDSVVIALDAVKRFMTDNRKDPHGCNLAYGMLALLIRYIGAVPLDQDLVAAGVCPLATLRPLWPPARQPHLILLPTLPDTMTLTS